MGGRRRRGTEHRAAGSEGGAGAQNGRAAGQHLCPTAPTRFPCGSPRIPHGFTHVGRAHSENSKRKKAFGNSPELVKGKNIVGCFKWSLNFSDSFQKEKLRP